MKKQNKRKKIFKRGAFVGDPRYTDAMKISIPYCKERLLHNEIPELAMTFNMGGSDVEFTTHPSDHCISILYSTDKYEGIVGQTSGNSVSSPNCMLDQVKRMMVV